MAYITVSPSGFGLFERTRSVLGKLLGAGGQRAAYNRTHKELSRLTDRELADIGLQRWQIADICSNFLAK